MRILIIEDESELREDIAKGLRLKGFSVDTAKDGEEGSYKISDGSYDLAVIDLNLPKKDGFQILQELVHENNSMKTIILSAYSEIENKLRGFHLGASDYIVKPFHFDELEARIRLLLHREFIQKSSKLVIGTLEFDTMKRIVTVGEYQIPFTGKELSLLEYFLLNQGRIISQQELIEHVWDENVDIFSNSIRVHMSSLRKKLKCALSYDPIITKIGEGYILK